jgi:hypothetical protein
MEQFPTLKNFREASKVSELREFSEQIDPGDELKCLLSSALGNNLPADLLSGGYIKIGYDA